MKLSARMGLLAVALLAASPSVAQTINPEPPLRMTATIIESDFDADIIVVGEDVVMGRDPSSGRDRVYWLESRISKQTGNVRHRLWMRYIYRMPQAADWTEAADDTATILPLRIEQRELLTCNGGCLRRETIYADLPNGNARKVRFSSPQMEAVIVDVTLDLVGRQGAAVEKALAACRLRDGAHCSE